MEKLRSADGGHVGGGKSGKKKVSECEKNTQNCCGDSVGRGGVGAGVFVGGGVCGIRDGNGAGAVGCGSGAVCTSDDAVGCDHVGGSDDLGDVGVVWGDSGTGTDASAGVGAGAGAGVVLMWFWCCY